MASSTIANANYHSQHPEASNNQFLNRSKCFAIDGSSSHLSNALQVVTEALSSTENVSEQTCSGDNQLSPSRIPTFTNNLPVHTFPSLKLSTLALSSNGEKDDQRLPIHGSTNILHSIQPTHSSESTSECQPEETQLTSNSSSAMHFPSSESIRAPSTRKSSDPIYPHQAPNTSATGKTVVAADSDVSNGFVKDGKMLPYVFEANESGKYLRI